MDALLDWVGVIAMYAALSAIVAITWTSGGGRFSVAFWGVNLSLGLFNLVFSVFRLSDAVNGNFARAGGTVGDNLASVGIASLWSLASLVPLLLLTKKPLRGEAASDPADRRKAVAPGAPAEHVDTAESKTSTHAKTSLPTIAQPEDSPEVRQSSSDGKQRAIIKAYLEKAFEAARDPDSVLPRYWALYGKGPNDPQRHVEVAAQVQKDAEEGKI